MSRPGLVQVRDCADVLEAESRRTHAEDDGAGHEGSQMMVEG